MKVPRQTPADIAVVELLWTARTQRSGDAAFEAGLDALLVRLPNLATDYDAAVALLDSISLLVSRGATPDEPARAVFFDGVARVADRVAGSGVFPLSRPSFLSDELLRLLRDEARAQLTEDPLSTHRTTRGAGDVLAHVAVSRQLREACSVAAGIALVPTLDALYEYDPPNSHVRTHLDGSGYPWTCHLLVEHRRLSTNIPEPSVLLAHVPGEGIRGYTLYEGDAVVLRGRSTLHAWKQLGPDERRTLTAVGFRSVTDCAGPNQPCA